MLDINLIRENAEAVKKDLKKRGSQDKIKLVDELYASDRKHRELIAKANEFRHKRNVVSEEISRLKAARKDFSRELGEVKEIPKRIADLEKQMQELKEKIDHILLRLPNILHQSVPEGKDEGGNQEIRKWGDMPDLDFAPKDHINLGQSLKLIDVDKAGKVAGARFYYLRNELVLLNYALIKFALDMLSEKGFVLYQPPYMLRRKGIENATDISDFEDVIYKVEGEDLYLLATSEHALLGLHADEILDGSSMPLRYCGVSPCFRKEAGTHGRDTKGIFRVHQFEKVEQFVFCKPSQSWKEHEMLIANAEELFQKIKIPYRVMNVCTGDIGSVAAKKYDLEAWLPGQGAYREMVSCSNCTDYQARRANVRYRDKPGEPTELAHTLNSTFIATERVLIAILENYQQKDGSVEIPEVLKPYMNGLNKIMEK